MSAKDGVPAHLLPRWEFGHAVLSKRCGLSAIAKLTLLAIDRFRSPESPSPFPSQDRLSTDTSLKPRTIRKALAEAIKGGWLQRHSRLGANGQRLSDGYDLVVPDWYRQEVSSLPPVAPDAGGTGTICLPPVAPRAYEVVKEATSPRTGGRGSQAWLTPYLTLYGERCGTVEPSLLGKCVSPARGALGDEVALKTLGTFLDSDPSRFGIRYFEAHWRKFVPEKLVLENGDLNPKALDQAKRLGMLT